jgi:hypothetical protein
VSYLHLSNVHPSPRHRTVAPRYVSTEALARASHGDRYVNKQQASAELGRVNREIRRLRAELAELEERRAKLSADLREP